LWLEIHTFQKTFYYPEVFKNTSNKKNKSNQSREIIPFLLHKEGRKRKHILLNTTSLISYVKMYSAELILKMLITAYAN